MDKLSYELGRATARDENADLRAAIAAAPPADVAGWLYRLAAGDRDLAGRELAGFKVGAAENLADVWRKTGRIADLNAAIRGAEVAMFVWRPGYGEARQRIIDRPARRPPEAATSPDPRRRRVLAAATFDLLRAGASGRELVGSVRRVAESLGVDAAEADRITLWAAGVVAREAAHA